MSDQSGKNADPSPLKRALFAVKDLTARLDKVERARVEPVAIVGMGCRFPGSASSPSSFWDLLRRGESAVGEVPAARWDIDQYYDADLDKPGRMYTRHGGFIEGVDLFDPRFFGISPREAESMDPQQRLLLEVAWEALEDAAQNPAELAGSSTGVFVGISVSDYGLMLSAGAGQARDLYAGTGNALSIAAGRLSYFLGLNGPALAVDTACSSSLMTVHLAIQSLRNEECVVALAGGVNLMFSPEASVLACRGHMLAPDGRCKTFDADADGYVRGEGCGIVVLKRLRDAVAAGDRVLAVLRGSAANQDGRSAGLTAPNGAAQEALLRSALRDARIAPQQVGYVEAHGTGTNLGDPIEMRAIQSVYCADRAPHSRLRVGSVKTNIGHLEPAAGIAGLIKVVSSLIHGAIPASLNFETPNPNIPWDGVPVEVPTRLVEWARGPEPRCAGVSAFGFSGTNVHVIVQEAPECAPPAVDPIASDTGRLLTVSARSEPALRQQVRNIEQHLQGQSPEQFADSCFTANVGRARFEHRLALIASSAEEACGKLRRFADGDVAAAATGVATRAPRVAFLFTGQGSQYAGMGQQLFESQPVFREAIEECDRILGVIDGHRLIDVLYRLEATVADALLLQTGFAQPALFAVEYALTRLWRSWGIEPGAVLGHSVGEYAAACAAGVFSLRDGLTLLAARARLMQSLPAGGGMLAVTAEEPRLRAFLEASPTPVSIAAINGLEDLVLSGDLAGLREIDERLKLEGMTTKFLNVSHAFHSALMKPMLDEFEQVANGLTYRIPTLRLISNVTGRPVSVDEPMDAAYWRQHVLAPVQFGPSLQSLRALKYDVFLEIGPHPVLAALGRKADTARTGSWLASLRRTKSGWLQMRETVGELFVRGLDFDARGLELPARPRKTALPTYPFERARFWARTAVAPDVRPDSGQCEPAETSRLARSVDGWFYELGWESAARSDDQAAVPRRVSAPGPWLIFCDRHGVGDAVASAFAARGEAVYRVFEGPSFQVGDDRCVQVQPDSADDIRALFAFVGTMGAPVRGVVHLWSLNLPPLHALTAADFDASCTKSCASVLHVVQAAGVLQPTHSPRTWLVTRGAQRVAGEAACEVLQASLWGFGRSLAAEHSELWGGLIDLDPADQPKAAAEQICAEALHPDAEDQIAFRSSGRYAARLSRRVAAPVTRMKWRADATYLLTGGLGGIALEVARWMIRSGARRLILLGRSALPARSTWSTVDVHSRTGRRIAAVRALESMGASIHLAAVDVADEAQLRAFLDTFREEGWPPIRGVVHAAGIIQYESMDRHDAASMRAVIRPKVVGAWLLHELLRNEELDCFVLCSSASALLNSPMMGSYAAANAMLDALAYHRAGSHLVATSINWGSWSGVGMAADHDGSDLQRSSAGSQSIAPEEGIAALECLAASGVTQMAVLPIDWHSWARSYPAAAQSPLLRNLVAGAPATPATRESMRLTRSALAMSDPDGRAHLAQIYVAGQIESVLGLNDTELDHLQPITTLGLDSLMAIEIKNRFEADLGIVIPVVTLLQGPSVRDLAEILVAGAAADGANTADRPVAASVEEGEF